MADYHSYHTAQAMGLPNAEVYLHTSTPGLDGRTNGDSNGEISTDLGLDSILSFAAQAAVSGVIVAAVAYLSFGA